MYKKFFGFKERPFQLVPNPAYLFLSKSHEEALAHLSYAVSQGDGFVEITGEVGTGKTTLCRVFLGNLGEDTEAAYIFNPLLDAVQLLKAINDEFGIDSRADTAKELIDTLNVFLMEKKRQGRQVIVLIDEAQKLGEDVLEQLRLLSNLETDTSKLLQIILVGQPELREMLDSRELRQLGQRITLSCYLTPLDFRETRAYIQHRIQIASQKPGVKFTRGAFWSIYRYSGGIPRLINIASDRALLAGYGLNKRKITGAIAKSAIRELASRGEIRRYGLFDMKSALLFLLVMAVGLTLLLYASGNFKQWPSGKPASSQETPPPTLTQTTPSAPDPPAPEVMARAQTSAQAVAKENPEAASPEPPPAGSEATPSESIEPDKSPISGMETPSTENDPRPPSPETIAPDVRSDEAPILAKKEMLPEKPMVSTPLSTPEEGDATKTEPDQAMEKLEEPAPASPGPSPETIVPVNLSDLIQKMDETRSRDSAIQTIMGLWQPDVIIKEYLNDMADSEDFFRLAARQNAFSILRIEADLALIQKLNLPAVLQLSPKDDESAVFLPVTGTGDGKLILVVDGNTRVSVPSADLDPFWKGIAYIPWKNYYGLTGIIPRSASKDSIASLKMLLRDIGFRELVIDSVYDAKTLQAVEYIQKKHAVPVDGSVGPLTKIILYNEVASLRIPHLSSQDASGSGKEIVR